jgi:hypothetical protein
MSGTLRLLSTMRPLLLTTVALLMGPVNLLWTWLLLVG